MKYECRDCGHEFEASGGWFKLVKCPSCGSVNLKREEEEQRESLSMIR